MNDNVKSATVIGLDSEKMTVETFDGQQYVGRVRKDLRVGMLVDVEIRVGRVINVWYQLDSLMPRKPRSKKSTRPTMSVRKFT